MLFRSQRLASTETTTNKPSLNIASLKDARAVVEEGGCANWGPWLISLTKLTNLVWDLLQGLKRPLGTLGLEDLPYASEIVGLTPLKTVKRTQTSTTGSTQ